MKCCNTVWGRSHLRWPFLIIIAYGFRGRKATLQLGILQSLLPSTSQTQAMSLKCICTITSSLFSLTPTFWTSPSGTHVPHPAVASERAFHMSVGQKTRAFLKTRPSNTWQREPVWLRGKALAHGFKVLRSFLPLGLESEVTFKHDIPYEQVHDFY